MPVASFGKQPVDDQFQPESASERHARHEREDMRDSLFLQAPMRYAEDVPAVVMRVRNLSAGGLMADCAVHLEVGQPVEVDVRNIGAVPGHIAWVQDGQIGVAFDYRIQPHRARSPVGTRATESMLVKQPNQKPRRPGLRIE
jgi:hypothetical protein